MVTLRPMRIALLAGAMVALLFGAVPVSADTGGGGPAPFQLSIDPTGTVTRLGLATITGTINCDGADSTVFLDLNVGLTQPVGRLHAIQGNGYLPGLTCTPGSLTAFSIPIIPYNGKFGPGFATAFGDSFGCDDLTCGESQATTAVTLKR